MGAHTENLRATGKRLMSTTSSFSFEDQTIEFVPGQSVGAALVAASVRWHRSAEDGTPRGLTCAIGVCWECRCVIDDRPNVRACMARARAGMVVRRQKGLE